MNSSVRLEAPVTRESDFFHLERTYSVDTVVYILNRSYTKALKGITPQQAYSSKKPSISHFRIFGCAVYIPIAPPQIIKIGPQHRLKIYV